MVRLEELEALDLMLWLRSGNTVAALVGANQSSISRRCQRVLSCFRARLLKGERGWTVHTRLQALLDLERHLHQLVRLHRRQGLRLNVPHWSQPPLWGRELPGWILNPAQGPLLCDNPLELLRGHVIDACLITPTQLSPQREDLALFELYGTGIDLYDIGDGDSDDGTGPAQAADVLLGSQLRLIDFLPSSCRLASQQRFAQLGCDLGLPESWEAVAAPTLRPVAFLTPLMAARLRRARRIPLAVDWPYREMLAVLRCHAEEPPVQQLVASLRRGFARPQLQVIEGHADIARLA